MKNLNRKIVQVILIIFVSSALFMIVDAQTAQQWVVPAKSVTVKNPTAMSKENIANGKDLYAKHCKSCHGTTGLGDGPKAAALDVACGDFTTAKFQGETDGAIFFKISEGHGKMPSFKKNITDDNDRWMIVHYLRTLKAK
jgi:mono/diheme cytochrome c family protein